MKHACWLVIGLLGVSQVLADVPLFAAKCSSGITADSNTKGQVYVNGKVAKLIHRPDGQITAQSAGLYVDITPRGMEPPRVTYTGKDKSFGTCEILSFKAPEVQHGVKGGASALARAPSSERAGMGQFDAHAPVRCTEDPRQSMRDCDAAVARDPGGSATVVITRPDGRKRFIFFENGQAIGADLSQADGSQHFRASKHDDVFHVEAGNERYEFVDALIFGG